MDSCRFITIAEIKKRIKEDNFTYKSVRIIGKLKMLQDIKTGMSLVEAVDLPENLSNH